MGIGQVHCYNHLPPPKKESYSREEAIKHAFDFYYDMSLKMKVPFNLISENKDNANEWFNENVK